MANYTASAGSKLEYKDGSTWKQIKGLKAIPEIGGEPNKIDTTSLDNTKYMTEINGLMSAPNLTFEFNLEDPTIEANIYLVDQLSKTATKEWKITYSTGITIEYKSDTTYSFNEVGVDEISSFTMYHAPTEEPTITIPLGSV